MARPKGSGKGAPAPVLRELSSFRAHLLAQRDGIDNQIATIDQILGTGGPRRAAAAHSAGPAPAARGRGKARGRRRGRRGPRAGSLKEYILKTLERSGKPMRVKDISSAVISAGYKSKNKTLGKSVGIALAQLGVKRVGRGLYGI